MRPPPLVRIRTLALWCSTGTEQRTQEVAVARIHLVVPVLIDPPASADIPLVAGPKFGLKACWSPHLKLLEGAVGRQIREHDGQELVGWPTTAQYGR